MIVEGANFVRSFWGMSGNHLLTMRIPLSLCYSDSFAASEAKKKKKKTKNSSLKLYKLAECLWERFAKIGSLKERLLYSKMCLKISD